MTRHDCILCREIERTDTAGDLCRHCALDKLYCTHVSFLTIVTGQCLYSQMIRAQAFRGRVAQMIQEKKKWTDTDSSVNSDLSKGDLRALVLEGFRYVLKVSARTQLG